MVRGAGTVAIAAVLVLACTALHAQISVQPNVTTLPLGKDTLCFSYRFYPNDTLVYTVEANDSIGFLADPTILRIRRERIRIVCDSVTPDMICHLTLSMISYAEKSSTGNDTSSRSTHPWVNRNVRLGIDTLGRRVYAFNTNAAAGTIAPGGAFQPLLLPPLDTSCGRQNQSWMYEDTIALAENGVPYPLSSVAYLWRVLDKVDTLGKSFRQIQYTSTGFGGLSVRDKQASFDLQCQMAGYGKITFDDVLGLPYAMFATAENRLTMKLSNGHEKEGVHKLMMQTFLVYVHRKN